MNDLEKQYRKLRDEIKARGYMKRTYAYHGILTFLVLAGFAVSFKVVTLTDNIWIQLLNAVFFAFVTVQAGMLGHDFSHGQVFNSRRLNRFFGLGIWGLLLGGSESFWYKQHNDHHEHVNQDGHDPDINIPFLFKEGQRVGSFSFSPWITKYQHVVFFASLPVWYVSKLARIWADIRKILSSFRGVVEVVLAVAHFAVLLFVVFGYLPFITAVMFLLIHVTASGFYMGMVFAPNHKGEEILSADTEITWLHQITSTRNLYSNFLTFHALGGLNLQIEHHLFPGMSRYQYPKVQKLVKQFCLENNIRYHETTWLGSMKEIYVALKQEAERR